MSDMFNNLRLFLSQTRARWACVATLCALLFLFIPASPFDIVLLIGVFVSLVLTTEIKMEPSE